jgi:hypothetical protein
MVEVRTQSQAKCPLRPGEPCSLCVPGASGPQGCGLAYLVMSDLDLRERLHQTRLADRARPVGPTARSHHDGSPL